MVKYEGAENLEGALKIAIRQESSLEEEDANQPKPQVLPLLPTPNAAKMVTFNEPHPSVATSNALDAVVSQLTGQGWTNCGLIFYKLSV